MMLHGHDGIVCTPTLTKNLVDMKSYVETRRLFQDTIVWGHGLQNRNSMDRMDVELSLKERQLGFKANIKSERNHDP